MYVVLKTGNRPRARPTSVPRSCAASSPLPKGNLHVSGPAALAVPQKDHDVVLLDGLADLRAELFLAVHVGTANLENDVPRRNPHVISRASRHHFHDDDTNRIRKADGLCEII